MDSVIIIYETARGTELDRMTVDDGTGEVTDYVTGKGVPVAAVVLRNNGVGALRSWSNGYVTLREEKTSAPVSD